MKPGMQRDILVAYWLLFDEFEIGEDPPPTNTPTDAASGGAATTGAPQTKPRAQD